MAIGKIRYNEDFSEYSVVFPDGEESDAVEVPDDGLQVVENEAGDQSMLAVLLNFDDSESNLEKNALYALSPIDTEVEEGVEFEDAEDEEEDEEQETATEPAEN
jgi:hypothetical protein